MNEITIAPIRVDQVTQITIDSEKMLSDAKLLKITSQEELDIAGLGLQTIKSRIKKLEESRKEITNPLLTAKRKVDELFKKPLSILETACELIGQGIIEYSAIQEKKRQEAEEKLRKELEKKAERAEKSGKTEKAEDLRTQAEVVTISPTVEKPAGISYRDIYKYKVVDESIVERQYLTLDHFKISKIVNATKGELVIKGLQIYSEKIVVTRTSEF